MVVDQLITTNPFATAGIIGRTWFGIRLIAEYPVD